jgi:hypothetical protein
VSRFEPVWLPGDKALNGRANQTLLRKFNLCPRGGYLHRLYDGGAPTPAMQRGSAFHRVVELATLAAIENGEPVVPSEIVKDYVDVVLASPEYHVPVEEHDLMREAAARWADETAIDPAAVIGCETLFVLDVAGWEVRARVDFAEIVEGGGGVHVVDYKTGRGVATQEEIARVRPDGTLMAKNMQVILYALALVYGVPVRIENGEEVREPFSVASRAQVVRAEFVYPMVEDRDGKMLRRGVSLTRLELDAYRASLEALVLRLAHAESTGDWPAQASDEACGQCAAPRECPIPAELRDHAGRINTREEAEEAAEKLEREKALHRARQAELKAWAKANGGALRVGQDKVQEFVATRSEEIKDKEGLWVAVERAVRYGEPFEKSEHVVEKTGTSFKVRKLTMDELAAEAAEGVEDGNDKRSLDERFGADAPW